MGAQGSAIVDFSTGLDHAEVAVTGQATYAGPPTNLVEAWLDPQQGDTTDNTVDAHIIAAALTTAYCKLPVAATGFTIGLASNAGMLYGKYNVSWVWN